MFSNSGIHIYDIKLDGNNNSGKLGFKLRKNEDIKDFENRKNEVFKIMTIGVSYFFIAESKRVYMPIGFIYL